MIKAKFEDWTQNRTLPTMGTNAGAPALAFQKWRHFKEAFAPELVARAVRESAVPVVRCLDPFGGSGTTALGCQFLGVHPVTVEVNPYLADLIEAKLSSYCADDVVRSLGKVLRTAALQQQDAFPALGTPSAPPTLVEPGIEDRWVFDLDVARRLRALVEAINELDDAAHQRLFRVILGGILVEVSNVVVNGKGRRYRRRWWERRRNPATVGRLFTEAVRLAISDIHRYRKRACLSYEVVRGDARSALRRHDQFELAVFSPPYPNSFDYTDVYNLELWVLGYLGNPGDNRRLRKATLCSHVQVEMDYQGAPACSPILLEVIERLDERSQQLWHRQLPAMIGAYFRDITMVLSSVRNLLADRGSIWMVVGDSRYAGVLVPTARIITELATSLDLKVLSTEPFRSMRSSAQQGGNADLVETLLVLSPAVR